ncbi:acetyltransferase [Enterobacteriaceae bacterium RIT691]|nr:acetyltransferase [Enterobacteriaceae bacterium RIT691]
MSSLHAEGEKVSTTAAVECHNDSARRNKVVIRRSQCHEGEQLVEIWCRAVDATHTFLSASDRAEIEAQVSVFLPEAPLWVATREDDVPLAFMLLSEHHLEALFVDPAARGQGIGKKLIEHALSLIPDLTTEVNEQNDQAVGFYRKMGFVVTGRSETDDHGRPYPLLHLQYQGSRT